MRWFNETYTDGYRIKNDLTVIDEAAPAKVRKLYKGYLKCLSLATAAN